MTKILVVSFLSIVFVHLNLFAEEKETVNWLSIEEAEARALEDPRKIFVDIYTDWCGWCKRMDANTLSHPVIARYLNENFYPVKLNAEQKEPITFRGVEYVLNESGEMRRPTHNFAIALLQGRMSYPSVAFFDEELNLITALPGYREPKPFEAILTFFNEDVFLDEPDLNVFIESFQGEIE